MNEGAIGLIIAIGFCYAVLTVFIPALFLYRYIEQRPFAVRFAIYQVTGNIWLIVIGFVLSFLNIWSEPLVIMLTIVMPLLVNLLVYHRNIFTIWINYSNDKKAGLVTKAATLQSLRRRFCSWIRTLYYRYIRYHYVEIILLIVLAVFAIWYYGYFKVYNFTYASSDEATHLYWVNSLFGGQPFPVGMYPHSMHFVMAAIHSMSGMQTLIVNHYFSVIIMLVLHLMLFFTVKDLFRSAAAAIGAVGLYVFTDMFTTLRYHNTLPMEFGFIAMLAMIILLTEFIKRRERFDMWLAALATGWTFHAHFYVTIFCVFLWLAFLIVYLKSIIRLKVIKRTILAILLSVAIAVVPFAIGFAAGHPFEQSIGWAMGVMGVSSDNSDTLNLMLNGIDSLDREDEEEENITESVAEVPEQKLLTVQQVEFMDADNFEEYLTALEHLLTVRVVRTSKQALFIYILIVFGVIYGIFEIIRSHLLFRKTKESTDEKIVKQIFLVRNGLILYVPLLVLFGIVCAVMGFLGLPEIIDSSRAAMILAPVTALLFAIPIAFAEDLLKMIPVKNKKYIETVMLLLTGFGLGWFYAKGPVKKLESTGVYGVTQQLSNELSYDLVGTHTRNTWTVISPVNDLLAIRYYGYHYEIIDLLMNIEDGEEIIYMPTNDLYVVVEKKVMNATGVFYLPDYHKDLAEQSTDLDFSVIDENYYDLGLPWMSAEEAYTTFRSVTMSKLYCWMEEIKKAYPNEVEVYSEDDLCIVYHIRQSADFPLNLALDYRIKNKGVHARDDFEIRYARENGLEYEPGTY